MLVGLIVASGYTFECIQQRLCSILLHITEVCAGSMAFNESIGYLFICT